MKEVTAYKCEWCNMVSLYKGHVKRHEQHHCRKSPERRCCGLCVHMNTDTKTACNPFHDGWWCEELDKDLDSHELNINNECECFVSKIVVNTEKS